MSQDLEFLDFVWKLSLRNFHLVKMTCSDKDNAHFTEIDSGLEDSV